MILNFNEWLFESRNDNIQYSDEFKIKTGEITKVVATLKGKHSEYVTKIMKELLPLRKTIAELNETQNKLSHDAIDYLDELFDESDLLCTRAIKTASYTLTLSKKSLSVEKSTVVTDWESIAKELASMSSELTEKFNELKTIYTKVEKEFTKGTSTQLKSIEKIDEGISDIYNKIKSIINKFKNSIKTWLKYYDKNLLKIQKKLNELH